MFFKEVGLTEENIKILIDFSREWEKENSTYGYRANTKGDLTGNRIFLLAIMNKSLDIYLVIFLIPNECSLLCRIIRNALKWKNSMFLRAIVRWALGKDCIYLSNAS